jgi:predicted TIM-barrel fold metal-dependent hydrolase
VTDEPALDPERPIIDPHLHLWDIQPVPGGIVPADRFLLPEALALIEASGHNVTHTVFVECHTMHRPDGPPELRTLGETEFAVGVAAMSASGVYGPRRINHRIVGSADLRLGAAVEPVLELHAARAGERFRGIRYNTVYSASGLFGRPSAPEQKGLMLDPTVREGARVLARMGFSLDQWCFHTQLGELADFADAVPELTFILDHLGTPETHGAYAGRDAEAHAEWARALAALARRPNVFLKVGGMGMDVSRMMTGEVGRASSRQLAEAWRGRIETCIEAFTPARCMFESNWPPDKTAGRYGAIWNAFKLVTEGYSEDEKDQLFRRTAARAYRIEV